MSDVRFQAAETPLPRPKGGWKRSPFKAGFQRTLNDLERELGYLAARDIIIIAGFQREHIRLDGWPRSSARAMSPGITITFESKHGSLRYDCNTYDSWQDNLRAFCLTLERLRAIDRYGCTKGEQYAGWRALPPAEGKRIGGGFSSTEDAAAFILKAGGFAADGTSRRMVIEDVERRRAHYRDAARKLHPDTGGDAEQFAMLQEAKRLIEGAA